MGLLVVLLLLALVFGVGTVMKVAVNVLVVALIVTLVVSLLGYAGLRGRSA